MHIHIIRFQKEIFSVICVFLNILHDKKNYILTLNSINLHVTNETFLIYIINRNIAIVINKTEIENYITNWNY